ncbi:MAG: type I methionyl aminopeptidase [Phycisphaeraceae bacterium]|nr:type I methionyl aminopeptidase [Phycisphaeraceae bacterium]
MAKCPTAQEVEAAFAAAQCVVETHRRLVGFLRVGQRLPEIDQFVATTLADLGARSCFLGYRVPKSPAFPSHACLSVNECIVHGTAGYYEKPMGVGDVLKIDIGVVKAGWIGDAAWTYAFKEYPSEQARRLMASGRESLRAGVAELRPGNTLLHWARAVQAVVEKQYGFHLVRGLGGHGYGRRLHESPFVSNVVSTYAGEWPDSSRACEPGMLLAVEPMIAIGTSQINQPSREWPIYTADRSLAVHYEHDVLITNTGPRVLTEGLDDLPDLVG